MTPRCFKRNIIDLTEKKLGKFIKQSFEKKQVLVEVGLA